MLHVTNAIFMSQAEAIYGYQRIVLLNGAGCYMVNARDQLLCQ